MATRIDLGNVIGPVGPKGADGITESQIVSILLSKIYPIGTIYMSIKNINPSNFIGRKLGCMGEW